VLESIVELMVYLFVGPLTLLAGSCIVGSVVVALRAVGHGSVTIRGGEGSLRLSRLSDATASSMHDGSTLGINRCRDG
jgi:hypothetical protein